MIEFTGERVVPGEVDIDLWNEHLARYAFAARLAGGRRVLDAGCGTGYGSAVLAERAASVTAFDIAPEAIAYAREHYAGSGVRFLEGSCTAMPVADAAFDLVVSFEVIEHLADWRAFLDECRRVLAPEGALLLSTPNRAYYAENRERSGPNPFHVHEFDFDELAATLAALFPHVELYQQNHVDGIAFQPASANGQARPELQQAGAGSNPREAHFLLALCSASVQPAPGPLVYVPSAANVLREREIHIGKLETDVAGLREEKQKMVDLFREQKAALEEGNRWSRDLNAKIAAQGARILELQGELETMAAGYQAQVSALEEENRAKTAWAQRLDEELAGATARVIELEAQLQANGLRAGEVAAGIHSQLEAMQAEVCSQTTWGKQLAARVAELEAELESRTAWARSLDTELEAKGRDLVHCVEVLHETERLLEERTALMLRFQGDLAGVRISRWVKLGRRMGLGPKLSGE